MPVQLQFATLSNQQLAMEKVDSMPEFLELTVAVLNNAVYNWSLLLIPQVHRDLIEQAWSQCLDDLNQVDWDAELSYANMAKVGLSGVQLGLKLGLLNEAVSLFKAESGVSRLLNVLDWLNKILGSAVIAAPALEPIKEMKEIIEGIIKRL